MVSRRHRGDTRTFEELDFAEQAKSISAQIVVLQRAIRAHARRTGMESNRDADQTMLKCIGQVSRLLTRLTQ